MSEQFEDVLDRAATRLRDGTPIGQLLVSFPADAPALLPLLESVKALVALQRVELPNRLALAADRRLFLEQAAHYREPAVSAGPVARLIAWTQQTMHWPQAAGTKETRPMFALLAKIIVITALGLSAAGGTVAAATDSMPDSALYVVKIGVEDVRLSLAKGPAEEAELAMAFARERVQEMQQMALDGRVPPEEVMNRFHVQLQTALQQTAQVDKDEEMIGLLQQMQQQVRYQQDELAETPLSIRAQVRERIQQVEAELDEALATIEEGLGNAELYRYRYGAGRSEDAPQQPAIGPQPETPVQNQLQHRQGVPVEEVDAEGSNDALPEQDVAPEPGGEQKGDLDRDRTQDKTNQPEDVPAGPAGPVENHNGQGAPAEQPAPPAEPVQNQNQQGEPAVEPDPPGEPAQDQQNQQQGPSSEIPAPAEVQEQEQTQEETGPCADPPTEEGEQNMDQTQDGPPEEYPEPESTQEQQQGTEPTQPGNGQP